MELKVIESKLVPVYETDTGERVVYGTELYEVLKVKSRFNDWVRNRLNDCDAIKNQHFESFTKNLVSGGIRKEYIIKLDTAKEMAILERNEQGKRVRRYLIEIENKYTLQKQKVPTQLLQLELEAIKEVNNKIELVKKELENFRLEMPLLGVDCDEITYAKNRKIVPLLGGKESPAYRNRSLRTRVYSDINKEIKRQFQVPSYKAIKRNELSTILKIIKQYKLPMALAEEIQQCNEYCAI